MSSYALQADGMWSAKRAWELGILRDDGEGGAYWHGEQHVIVGDDWEPIALDDWS